jgi:hypothetical protein
MIPLIEAESRYPDQKITAFSLYNLCRMKGFNQLPTRSQCSLFDRFSQLICVSFLIGHLAYFQMARLGVGTDFTAGYAVNIRLPEHLPAQDGRGPNILVETSSGSLHSYPLLRLLPCPAGGFRQMPDKIVFLHYVSIITRCEAQYLNTDTWAKSILPVRGYRFFWQLIAGDRQLQ